MTRSFPTFFSTHAAWISLLGLTVAMASCGGAYRQASALEDDELYLSQGEEFLTDKEYLSYAFEQAGFSSRKTSRWMPARATGSTATSGTCRKACVAGPCSVGA